jgi:general L-amino acid transport system permease protein
MAIAAPPKPPPWRNVRVLRVVGQIVFVVLVIAIAREMYLNATYQLAERGDELTWGFLDSRAGFSIKEHIISYSQNGSFWRAFWVAVTNAMLVAFVGIVLTTILGLIVGIARLSPNWLLRKISQVYVEVIRNTPALVQIVFWYVAVILPLRQIAQSFSLFDVVFLSNRAAAVPTVKGGRDLGLWWLFAAAGLIAAIAVRRWRTKLNDETGEPHYRVLWSLGTFVAIAGTAFLLLGDAFTVQTPRLGLRNYEGGIQVSAEFAAITIGLVVYTAAFIAEIVRGSILAVSRGQKEAGEALGLRPRQQLRYVVLPQALRIALPSVTNQYLNLWKNTSLAFAVGYPEIINITTTMINQAGHALEVFMLVVLAYLVVSLLISLVMNGLNRLIALKGVRT